MTSATGRVWVKRALVMAALAIGAGYLSNLTTRPWCERDLMRAAIQQMAGGMPIPTPVYVLPESSGTIREGATPAGSHDVTMYVATGSGERFGCFPWAGVASYRKDSLHSNRALGVCWLSPTLRTRQRYGLPVLLWRENPCVRARRLGLMMAPPNKAMKLTSLSAAPGLNGATGVDGGAASYPRRRETAGTGSQLIASVLRTSQRRRACAGRE